MSNPIPKFTCPGCGYVMEAATVANREDELVKPYLGCFTICAKCGEIGIFNEDLTQRMPTLAELTA